MEPYDSISRMMNKKESETRESSKHEADHAFSTALRRVLAKTKGPGSKAAIRALYRLETEFHAEMGIDE